MSALRTEGKTVRYFITLASVAMVATSTVLNLPLAYGHGGDDHDKDLETIPTGPITLLPDTHKVPSLDGVIGPVLPMHAMSVHNTITWKKNKKLPLMLMFHRHSGYRADEVMNPDVVDFLIRNRNPSTLRNAFADVNNQFNSAFRRSFNQFAYGGYNIIHDVSQSVPTRISLDQTKEITQLWDMNHPDAFKFDYTSPPYSSAAIVNADAELNGNAFYDAGPSRGMYYDMYCPGFSTLSDGRAVFMGGHDLNSQNGNYRIQVFDPENESWAVRPASCMRKYFGQGIGFDGTNHGEYRVANLQPPTAGLVVTAELPATSERYRNDWNLEIYYRDKLNEFKANNPSATEADLRVSMRTIFLPNCNPHDLPLDQYSPTYTTIRLAGPNGTVTNPGKLTSDMKYARWYPTQITMPGNRIYIYAGWDRDESKYSSASGTPPASTTAMLPFISARSAALADSDPSNDNLYADLPANADIAGSLPSSNSGDFEGTRVKQVVGEVYDAATDSTIALENAPFFHNAWYPNGIVVQTGPGRNDWKIAVNDGDHLGKVKARTTGGLTEAYRSSLSNNLFHNTWLFDIQAALKDPNRNNPPGDSATTNAIETDKYHTFLSEANSSHSEFTGNANIVQLDTLGRVLSHKLVHMGGTRDTASSTLAQDAAVNATTLVVNFDGSGDADKPGLYTVGSGGTSERVYVTSVTVNPQTTPTETGFPTTATLTLRAPGLVTARATNVTVSINSTSDTAEEIDFASLSAKVKRGQTPPPPPKWKVVGQLYQPGRQNYCTPLPDGTVLVLGGNGGILPSIERWSLHTQLYDPSKAAGYTPTDPSTNSVRSLAKTLIPRDEHGIIQLMPDATVYLGGQNRNGIVVAGDSFAVQGDPDLGVPCAQLMYPPYLYDKRNEPAERPIIGKAPAVVDYGKPFKVSTLARKKIKTVSLIRSGSMSHSINTDVRLVKLAFKQKGSSITVYPPKFEGTAIAGYYQLFIVDENGVPSKGVKVQLGQYITKRIGKPADKFVLLDETGQ